jgi:uncharacterized membrane protein YfcA
MPATRSARVIDSPWILFVVGFLVSVVLTPAGVSGAFLLVPFQTSVLGLSSVSVTPTNLVFNLFATPLAIATYRRQGRLDGRLAGWIVASSVPGVLLGAWLRVALLSDPARFRAVVGAVLLALGVRLLVERRRADPVDGPMDPSPRTDLLVVVAGAVVGVVGGIYGIGGGAFLAPFLTLATRRSLHQIAGAALVGTFVTSLVGVGVFELLGQGPLWPVGLWLGLGGLAGGWLGASLQDRVPARALRAFLAVVVLGLGLYYVVRATLR